MSDETTANTTTTENEFCDYCYFRIALVVRLFIITVTEENTTGITTTFLGTTAFFRPLLLLQLGYLFLLPTHFSQTSAHSKMHDDHSLRQRTRGQYKMIQVKTWDVMICTSEGGMLCSAWCDYRQDMYRGGHCLAERRILPKDLIIIIIIYPLTARVVEAPQMIPQPVFTIFPCTPLPVSYTHLRAHET